MVKISVVYSVNKSLALYSIYSLCYLQTKSLRTSSPRKKNIVLTSWHFRSFSNYFRLRWVTSEYIDPKVCVLLLTWHAWNTVLNENLIDYEWNEIYYFELSQRHVNHVYHCWVCSFTLKMRSTVDALTPFLLISVRPESVCSLYIVFKRLDLFLMNKIFLKEKTDANSPFISIIRYNFFNVFLTMSCKINNKDGYP